LTSRIFELNDAHLNEIDADFGINAVVEITIEAVAAAFFDHSVVVNASKKCKSTVKTGSLPRTLKPMNKLHPITPMYEQIIRKTEQQIPPDVLLQPKKFI